MLVSVSERETITQMKASAASQKTCTAFVLMMTVIGILTSEEEKPLSLHLPSKKKKKEEKEVAKRLEM